MMYIFFIVISTIFFLFFTGVKLLFWISKVTRCTLRIEVEVIDVLVKGYRGGLVYKPIFRECETGRMIHQRLWCGAAFTVEKGERLWIKVNPSDWRDFLFEKPYINKIIASEVLSCALPLIGILIVLLWFLFEIKSVSEPVIQPVPDISYGDGVKDIYTGCLYEKEQRRMDYIDKKIIPIKKEQEIQGIEISVKNGYIINGTKETFVSTAGIEPDCCNVESKNRSVKEWTG